MVAARGHMRATSYFPPLPRRACECHALPLAPCTSPLSPWTPSPPLLPSRAHHRAELAVIVAVPMATGHP